jgi:hypothetical protein
VEEAVVSEVKESGKGKTQAKGMRMNWRRLEASGKRVWATQSLRVAFPVLVRVLVCPTPAWSTSAPRIPSRSGAV